jgi:hypothetical protein
MGQRHSTRTALPLLPRQGAQLGERHHPPSAGVISHERCRRLLLLLLSAAAAAAAAADVAALRRSERHVGRLRDKPHPGTLQRPRVRVALTPGCQIGYMETIPAVIN